jgi:hypothetical protein
LTLSHPNNHKIKPIQYITNQPIKKVQTIKNHEMTSLVKKKKPPNPPKHQKKKQLQSTKKRPKHQKTAQKHQKTAQKCRKTAQNPPKTPPFTPVGGPLRASDPAPRAAARTGSETRAIAGWRLRRTRRRPKGALSHLKIGPEKKSHVYIGKKWKKNGVERGSIEVKTRFFFFFFWKIKEFAKKLEHARVIFFFLFFPNLHNTE